MAGMRTIADIRHTNLLALLNRYSTLQAFADAVERSSAQISQQKYRSGRSSGPPRTMGDELARHIEAKLKLPPGWMDADHAATTWPFPDVDRSRYERLSAEDRAFVQRQVNMALADCEDRAGSPQGHPSRHHTVHEPRKRYRAA